MTERYFTTFWELICAPFQQTELIWGIVPLYFGWILNELTAGRASFTTAINTGFSFLWAGAQWTWQYFSARPSALFRMDLDALLAVNILVTAFVLLIGAVALFSGLLQRYPRYCGFLGHTRFSNYFMIAIFPIQSNHLQWSWERLIAIVIFAAPVWLLIQSFMAFLRWAKK